MLNEHATKVVFTVFKKMKRKTKKSTCHVELGFVCTKKNWLNSGEGDVQEESEEEHVFR